MRTKGSCDVYMCFNDLTCAVMQYMLLTGMLLHQRNYDKAMRAVAALRSASSSLGRGSASNQLVQELALRCAPGVAAQRLLAARCC